MPENIITKKIEELIQAEDSPAERVRLMLLLQISNILSDISKSNEEVLSRIDKTEEKIESHIIHNRRAEDKFSGAKKVVAALFFVVQGALGYLAYQMIETPKKTQEAVILIDKRLSILEARIQAK